jgi:HSP20 family protein
MTTGLIRWAPQADFVRSRMSRIFDDAFNDFLVPLKEDVSTRDWMPPVDIRETDEALVLNAEIPGLSKEDIEITVEQNVLTISGERRFEKDVKEESYHRRERVYGRFSRAFSLPANVQAAKVDATVKDGLLTVVLPKAEESKPRKVTIR